MVEGPKALTPGRALDLGCGTGTNVKYLLDRGWDVTGVDFVAQAMRTARRRAAGGNLMLGDVTKLAGLGVNGPFDLMFDCGCFHSIPAARRDAYVDGVSRVAQPGATLLMFAFGEGGQRGGPVAPEEEIRRRFGDAFDIAEVRPGAPFRKQTWYRLVRKSNT